jgi:hypothetical protein
MSIYNLGSFSAEKLTRRGTFCCADRFASRVMKINGYYLVKKKYRPPFSEKEQDSEGNSMAFYKRKRWG